MKVKKLTLLLAVLLVNAGIARAQTAVQCLIAGVWVPCSMAPQPQFAQAPVPAKSSGSVASISASYGSNTIKGNTLVVVFANGNASNPTAPITDTLSLKWFKAVQIANSTVFESEIWYAPNTVGGADMVTVTPGGSNASIAMTIYEVPGLVYPAAGSSPTGSQSIDQTTSNAGTGGTSPSVSITPIVPNEYVFVGFGLGTAAQTISVNPPYNNDSGQQNPTTPSGLFSFVSASLFKTEMGTSSPSATATSEPWAVAVASFKTLTVPIQGSVQGLGLAGTPSGGVVSVQGVSGGTVIPVNNTQQGTANQNLTQLDGTALGAPSNYGTSPGAVAVPGVNAYVTNVPSVSQSGTWTVGLASGSNTVGKVDVLGNSGSTMDSTIAAGAAPTNGLAIIGQYNTSAPGPTNTQTVAMQLGPNGNLIDQPYRRSQIITQATTITSTSATTVLNAQSSGIYADITNLIISTTSATPSTPFTVIISDGTKSYTFDLNTDQTVGPPTINIAFIPPLTASSSATPWTQTNSSATPTTHTTVVAVKQAANF